MTIADQRASACSRLAAQPYTSATIRHRLPASRPHSLMPRSALRATYAALRAGCVWSSASPAASARLRMRVLSLVAEYAVEQRSDLRSFGADAGRKLRLGDRVRAVEHLVQGLAER
jgi:hypothetical protein